MSAVVHVAGPVDRGAQACARCRRPVTRPGPVWWREGDLLRQDRGAFVLVQQPEPGSSPCNPPTTGATP